MNNIERIFERFTRALFSVHSWRIIANNERSIQQYSTLKHFIKSKKDSKGFLSTNSENCELKPKCML